MHIARPTRPLSALRGSSRRSAVGGGAFPGPFRAIADLPASVRGYLPTFDDGHIRGYSALLAGACARGVAGLCGSLAGAATCAAAAAGTAGAGRGAGASPPIPVEWVPPPPPPPPPCVTCCSLGSSSCRSWRRS
eukprot:15430300-Alexandrium_andersonii.AAC.1